MSEMIKEILPVFTTLVVMFLAILLCWLQSDINDLRRNGNDFRRTHGDWLLLLSQVMLTQMGEHEKAAKVTEIINKAVKSD